MLRVKTGGRDFKKGQSGNPNGRPKMPKELREAKRMRKTEFIGLLVKYLGHTLEELGAAKKDKKTPAIDRIVIAIVLNAIKHGDYKRLDFLMDRIIGKVQAKVDMTTAGESLNKEMDLSKLSDGELERFYRLASKCAVDKG